MPIVSSADHEAGEQHDERHVGLTFQLLRAVGRGLIRAEFPHCLDVLSLIEVEGGKEDWADHTCREHP